MKPRESNGARRDRALALLATGHGVTDVARACGVTRATVRRWGLDDDFQAELRRVRKAAAADLAGGMRDLLLGALGAAQRIVEDPEHPGHVEIVKAALKFLAPQQGGAGTIVKVDARQGPGVDLRKLSYGELQALRAIRARLEAPEVRADVDAAAEEAPAVEQGGEEDNGPRPGEETEMDTNRGAL